MQAIKSNESFKSVINSDTPVIVNLRQDGAQTVVLWIYGLTQS